MSREGLQPYSGKRPKRNNPEKVAGSQIMEILKGKSGLFTGLKEKGHCGVALSPLPSNRGDRI